MGLHDNSAIRLVLASDSPRRRDLLAAGGYSFQVESPPFDEPTGLPQDLTPSAVAQALAYYKARSVWDTRRDAHVLGADTLVALGSEIMGKPTDEAHARRMLHALSHSRHRVITGIALLCPSGERIIASNTTFVTMRPMGPADIDAYIESREWVGKSGSYAIQESADQFVTKLEGSFSNVVGLPMEMLGRLLKPTQK